jgi:hypothetical protein
MFSNVLQCFCVVFASFTAAFKIIIKRRKTTFLSYLIFEYNAITVVGGGEGTMLQGGRSRDRIPMKSLDFFN